MQIRLIESTQDKAYDAIIHMSSTAIPAGIIEMLGKGKGSHPIPWMTHMEGRTVCNVLAKLPTESDDKKTYDALSNTFKFCHQEGFKSILVRFDQMRFSHHHLRHMIESLMLTGYRFDKYKSSNADDKQPGSSSVSDVDILVHQGMSEELSPTVKEAVSLAQATILARNLINEPACVMTPHRLSEVCSEIGSETGLDVTCHRGNAIEKMGMNLFYAVGKGSSHQPVLIEMTYTGNPKCDERLGLIGKGLTYDSGGYSIKSDRLLINMHGDMAGAAAVIGAMKAIAEAKLPVNVVAVMPACENMVSEDAYMTGDIITSMNGKTVEIVHTDCEGRLALADAITFAIREKKVTKLIDIATLTGAIQTALGVSNSGLFCNDDTLRTLAHEASRQSLETNWELPCDDDLFAAIESPVADMRNSSFLSDMGGGSITAALFLKEFTEGLPWLHLDIAAVSWANRLSSDCASGGRGYGTRFLYHLVKAHCQ